MCYFCHAQLFEITHVANIKSTLVQHSCRNAEVVEAFCRVAASRSNIPVDQFTSRPLLHFTRLPRCPLHYLRFLGADIARRIVLASRLPSRAAPALNLHSARCLAGAQLPATSCLGAFRPPATSSCGGSRDPGVRKPAQERTSFEKAKYVRAKSISDFSC